MNITQLFQGTISTEVRNTPWYKEGVVWLSGKTKRTQETYQAVMTDFMAFVLKPFDQVDSLDVVAYKEELKGRGWANNSIQLYLSAVSSYYRHCVRKQVVTGNPADIARDDIRVDKYEGARKVSVGDFQALLGAIPETKVGARLRAVLLVIVYTGVRRQEVLNLLGGDIERRGSQTFIRVRQKGGKFRRFELPPPAVEGLDAYFLAFGRIPRNGQPVFVSSKGNQLKPVSGAAIVQDMKRVAEKAGLEKDKYSLHGFRHLFAETLHRASGDVHFVSQRLGHADPRSTGIYLSRIVPEENGHWEAMQEIYEGEK